MPVLMDASRALSDRVSPPLTGSSRDSENVPTQPASACRSTPSRREGQDEALRNPQRQPQNQQPQQRHDAPSFSTPRSAAHVEDRGVREGVPRPPIPSVVRPSRTPLLSPRVASLDSKEGGGTGGGNQLPSSPTRRRHPRASSGGAGAASGVSLSAPSMTAGAASSWSRCTVTDAVRHSGSAEDSGGPQGPTSDSRWANTLKTVQHRPRPDDQQPRQELCMVLPLALPRSPTEVPHELDSSSFHTVGAERPAAEAVVSQGTREGPFAGGVRRLQGCPPLSLPLPPPPLLASRAPKPRGRAPNPFNISSSFLRSRGLCGRARMERSDMGGNCGGGGSSSAANASLSANESEPYLSENVKWLRRHNMIFVLLLLSVAVLIALAGGLAVGFLSRDFAQESSRRVLEAKNRIVLNSSVSTLYRSQEVMSRGSADLQAFLTRRTAGRPFTSAMEMRDALIDDFLLSWQLWLSRTEDVDSYTMYVPFCSLEHVGTAECSTMLLMVSCRPKETGEGRDCFYGRNSDDGKMVELHDMPEDGNIVLNASRRQTYPLRFEFFANQTGARPYFLKPRTVTSIDGTPFVSLALRRQSYLPSGQVVICEAASLVDTWFDTFAASLQRAKGSYSMLFSSTGAILACQAGGSRPAQEQCMDASPTHCACKNDVVIKSMADAFLTSMPTSAVYDEEFVNGQYTQARSVHGYLATYQDFLLVRTGYGEPNVVFFAAYAMAIDSGISTEGAVQIVVCVVVIVLCVLILGLVAVVAILQLQKVIELVSRLATGAATYDTANMERALRASTSSSSHTCWGQVIFSTVIRDEFKRILENLQAYRPFLPASLLTHGHMQYEDSTFSIELPDRDGHSGVDDDAGSLCGGGTDSDRPSAHDGGGGGGSPQEHGHVRARAAAHYPLSAGISPTVSQGSLARSRTACRANVSGAGLLSGAVTPRELQRDASIPVRCALAAADRRTLPLSTLNPDSPPADGTARANTLLVGDELPPVNDRLRVGGMKHVKGTILVVELMNLDMDAKDATEVINHLVGRTVARAGLCNGVVDLIDATTIVVSFGCHYTVLRHQERAVRCALGIRDDLAYADVGYTVGMAIAAGPLYVGTIGTDTQRARVVTGDAVVVARTLTTLSPLLGATILVTDEVAHESGGAACVPVDVVRIYRPSTHTWMSHVVCSVIGPRTSDIPPSLEMAKKLFKLIRSRQLDEAVVAVEAIRRAAQDRGERLLWPVERLMSIVRSHPQLIQDGYSRRHILWEYPESDAIARAQLDPASVAVPAAVLLAALPMDVPPVSVLEPAQRVRCSDAVVAPASATAAAEDAASSPTATVAAAGGTEVGPVRASSSPPTLSGGGANQPHAWALVEGSHSSLAAAQPPPLVDETTRARAMLDEARRTSATRRRRGRRVSVEFNEEESLFPVFFPDADDEEEDDAAAHGDGPCAPDAGATLSPPRSGDIAATAAAATGAAAVVKPMSPDGAPSPASRAVAVVTPAEAAETGAGGEEGVGSAISRRRVSELSSDPVDSGRPLGHSDSPSHGALSNSAWHSGNPLLPSYVVSVDGQGFYPTGKLLGRGACGEVYLAATECGSFVALKVFPMDGFNADQLIREVQTLSKLRNEHIVAYDCCAVQAEQFFIMSEYMAAGSIKDLIWRIGKVPLSAARKYSRDILSGLSYLHKEGYLHCDIKPDNLLLTAEGACKIADFGAASLEKSVGVTGVRGTPRFMAPEAILGEWTTAADVYSFGLTLATMLTGRQPWHANPSPDYLFLASYAGAIREAREENVPCSMQPDLTLDDSIDAETVQLVQRCCAFDPAQRPTVDELIDSLL